jgi:hypothetical protein
MTTAVLIIWILSLLVLLFASVRESYGARVAPANAPATGGGGVTLRWFPLGVLLFDAAWGVAQLSTGPLHRPF